MMGCTTHLFKVNVAENIALPTPDLAPYEARASAISVQCPGTPPVERIHEVEAAICTLFDLGMSRIVAWRAIEMLTTFFTM